MQAMSRCGRCERGCGRDLDSRDELTVESSRAGGGVAVLRLECRDDVQLLCRSGPILS